jgi:hypothetical protein
MRGRGGQGVGQKPGKEKAAMTRHLYDANGKIKPDLEDVEMIERQCGPLPPNASDSQAAERHRLAAAVKLIRLYAEGKFPPKLMREMNCYSFKRRILR